MLRAAAAGRYPSLVTKLLRSGAADPDRYPIGALTQAATSAQPWPQALARPACPATAKLIKRAVGGWSMSSHHLYHPAFRNAVQAVLHAIERLRRIPSAVVAEGAVVEPADRPENGGSRGCAGGRGAASAAVHTARASATVATLPILPIELWLYVVFPLIPRIDGWEKNSNCVQTDRVKQ